MTASGQPPSPALLRLRAADVVRLCGLNAAADGLELVANHSVIASRRAGSRLQATVNDVAPHEVWVELADEAAALQWACDCAQSSPLACAHVAAVLSAWIAHPSDFIASAEQTPTVTSPDTSDTDIAPAPPSSTPRAASRAQPQPSSPTDSATLATTLARMNAADVAEIARRVTGLDVDAAADARQKMVAVLGDSAQLSRLLSRLDASARELFTLIYLAGGTLTAADLETMADRLARPVSATHGDLAVLERHALLLPMLPTRTPSQHGPGSSWRHVAGWRIPEEARLAFRTALPLDALPAQGASRLSPPLLSSTSGALQVVQTVPRALCLALALLAEAPPPFGLPRVAPSTNDQSTPTLRGAGLLSPGEIAPDRLKELARAAGLDLGAARLARRLLRLMREQHPSPSLADMARIPPAERPLLLRAAFRRWVRADSAADLLDAEPYGIQFRYAAAHPGFRPAAIASEVREGRRFVARLLRHAQPDTWYALESFLTLAWQANPGFLRGEQQAWATPTWWLESRQSKRVLQLQLRADWMAAEGAFIQGLLAGAFAAWGATDLAVRGDGSVAAFRLTSFGHFLFQRGDTPADAALVAQCDDDWGPPVLPLREGSLAVQPLAAGASLLDALALWAVPTGVSGRRLIYSLSADRACAAFDQHLAPTVLPGMLRPYHSRAAESVASQLERWYADWGRTRITTGFTLVEATDEATLVEALAAAPDIATRCRRIGPALALAQPADAAILREILGRQDYAV